MRATALAMLALMLLPAGRAWAADAQPETLVTAVAYGTHLPGLGEPASQLAKLLKERSGGALRLDLKQPGDGTKPDEILDKVSSGSIDAGFATSSFWAARRRSSSYTSGRSRSEAPRSPCSMSERMRVTSLIVGVCRGPRSTAAPGFRAPWLRTTVKSSAIVDGILDPA